MKTRINCVRLFAMLLCLLVTKLVPAQVDPNATQKTKDLLTWLTNLKNRSTNKVLSGNFGFSDTHWSSGHATDMFNATGKWPGLLEVNFAWKSSFSPNAAAHRQELIDYWNAGGIISVHMPVKNPFPGQSSGSAGTGTWPFSDVYTAGTPANDNLKAWFDELATHLQVLENNNIPVLLRMFHEAGHSGHWWSNNTVAQYKNLWNWAQSYLMNTKGLHNILYVYSPKPNSAGINKYPGSTKVDIMGVSIYGENLLGGGLGIYNLARTERKPFTISEIGWRVNCQNCEPATEIINDIKTVTPECVMYSNWNNNENKNFWHNASYQNNPTALMNDPWVMTRDEVDFGAPPTNPTTRVFQAEDLSYNANGASTSLNGAGTWVNLNAYGPGPWVEFTLPNVAAGNYEISVRIQEFNNGGQAQTSVSGTNIGTSIDFYDDPASGRTVVAGTRSFSTTGNKKVRFTVTGKNAGSSGHKIAINSITLTPAGNSGTFQAEDLSRTSLGASTSLGGSGSWVNLNAHNTGAWVEFTLPNVAAGTYDIKVNIQKFANGGQAQTAIGCSNQGSVIDFYNGGSAADPFPIGTKTFSNTGNKTIRFTITGRNAGSSGHKIAIDRIILEGTGASGARKVASSSTEETGLIEKRLEQTFNLYPNPATEWLNLSFYSAIEQETEMSIMDLSGRVGIVRPLRLYKGINEIQIPVGELANGMYLMTLTGVLREYRRAVIIDR